MLGTHGSARFRVRLAVISGAVLPAIVLIAVQPGRTETGLRFAPDFSMFHTAAGLAAEGHWEEVYDLAAFRDAHERETGERATVGGPTFGYPPLLAQALEPASRLPLGAALPVFLIGTVGLSYFGMKRLGISLKGMALVAASYPGVLTLWLGQNSFLSLAVVAAAFALIIRGRRFAGGLVLGALLFKPQVLVAVGLMFLLAPRRYRAVIAGSAASVAGLTAFSYVLSPSGWWEFPDGLRQLAAFSGNGFRLSRFGAIDFSYLLLGDRNALSPVLSALLVIGGVIVFLRARSRWQPDTSTELAMGIALAMWINPWGFVYEWVLLAVPAVLLIGSGRLSRPRGWLIFGSLGFVVTISGGIVARGVAADGTGLQLATLAYAAAVYFAFTDPVARPRNLVGADQ